MAWKKIKSGKGVMWSYIVYESDDRGAASQYKTVWKPTAKCKKEWEKHGGTAKVHTRYHKSLSEALR